MHGQAALFTDLYQLSMAQAWMRQGGHERRAAFHMSFRNLPFKGGFAIACGTARLAEALADYRFDAAALDYLASVRAPSGAPVFAQDFLDYLRDLTFELDIDSVREGEIVFPNEPLLRVEGPLVQCQMVETLLLNCVNFETLIATKAARIALAAQGPVSEFGLRRAQGPAGIWASRAAFVGGCSSTSDVLAGSLFGVPVSGTQGHSWIMAHDSELEAFRAWAAVYPDDCVLLIDTYDVRQGLENAIVVARELAAAGHALKGVRIDSGDLAWLASHVRERLDAEGLPDVKIVASNDLDEATIASIRAQGAPIDAWGVGTRLAVAFDQPTLGGVYKLAAIRAADGAWTPRLKLSEQRSKTTVPGRLDVRRYLHPDGRVAGDMVYDLDRGVCADEEIVDPNDSLRRKSLSGLAHREVLLPFMREGGICDPDLARATERGLTEAERAARAAEVVGLARERAAANLATLDDTQKRLLNPHSYPVGLERGLFEARHRMIERGRGLDHAP